MPVLIDSDGNFSPEIRKRRMIRDVLNIEFEFKRTPVFGIRKPSTSATKMPITNQFFFNIEITNCYQRLIEFEPADR